MSEAEGQVKRHVVGIIESGEDAEVGYVPNIHDEAGECPWFEGASG